MDFIDEIPFSQYLGLSISSKHNMLAANQINQKFSDICNLPLEKTLPPKPPILQTISAASSYYEALDLYQFDFAVRKRVREFRRIQKRNIEIKEDKEIIKTKSNDFALERTKIRQTC